jgi:hypothetical protein
MGYWESERLPKLIRNLFLGMAVVVGGIVGSAVLLALIWAAILAGAAVGLWHPHIEDR